jgi:hypothetical protein
MSAGRESEFEKTPQSFQVYGISGTIRTNQQKSEQPENIPGPLIRMTQ